MNDKITVNVESTEEISDLIYQITNRGVIIDVKFLKFPKTKATEFKVDVVFAMIPQCTIVVFYFDSDGGVISEEITVDFAENLPNYVSCPTNQKHSK